MKAHYKLLIFLVLGPFLHLNGQSSQDQLALDEFIRHAAVRDCSVSACFLNENGDIIAGFRSSNRAIPASSIKPVTSGFLWLEKGPGHRWTTSVGYRGQLDEEGGLTGDLIIRPTGDPSIGSVHVQNDLGAMLRAVADALKEKKIRHIKGGIFLDLSVFSDNPVPGSWPREDAGNYYGGGYWPLNVLDNSYTLCFEKREREGQQPAISSCVPKMDLRWQVRLVTGPPGSGDQAYIFGGPETRKKTVYGSIPAGEGEFCIKGSMPDPPRFFLDTLSRYLAKEGILSNFYGAMPLADGDKMIELYRHQSPSLQELLPVTLEKSLNLYTDAFLFAASDPDANTWDQAAGQLAAKIGLATGSTLPILRDGSGMSPANGISAAQIAGSLLYFIKTMPDHRLFLGCFPRDGERDIWLKSGSMSGVQAYSGYIRKQDGSMVSFSVMVNQMPDKDRAEVRRELLRLIRGIATGT